MSKKLDDTNKAICKALLDGRKPFSVIAEDLGITENTVRSRVIRLIEEGVLVIQGLVNPEKVQGMQVVIMGIKLNTMEISAIAQKFLHLRGVVSATVVTGRYDLVVQLVLNEEQDLSLLQFFSEELSKIPEVKDVETFVVYQANNLFVPYLI